QDRGADAPRSPGWGFLPLAAAAGGPGADRGTGLAATGASRGDTAGAGVRCGPAPACPGADIAAREQAVVAAGARGLRACRAALVAAVVGRGQGVPVAAAL